MKKMLVIIVILAMILVSMIIYKNIAINKNKSVNVQEVEQIEEYISKIYMWKEITKEALPTFENINNANELWVWEVIKKNLETYETTYEEIQQKGKELFGEKFERQIPKEGNDSFYYDKESNKYLATEIVLDEEEDSFLLKDIEKEGEKYKVKIIEYIEDYSEENKVIIRNLQDEETFTTKIKSGLSEDDYIAWADDTYKEGMKTTTEYQTETDGDANAS